VAKKSKTPRPPRSVQKREQRQAQRPNRNQQAQRRVPTTGGSWWSSGDRFWWVVGGAGAVVAVIIVAAVLATGGSAKPVHVDFAQLPGLQTGPPPWNNGSGSLQNNLSFVHLNPLPQEALAFHIHQHLDVYANGQHVTVPALIGIFGNSFITEMHTHTPDGVLHVESAKTQPYVLGQFFGEWGVRLNARCIGRYCGNLHWWVDGKSQAGNPADLIVHAHQEIVIAAGKPPAHIRSSYTFPAGE
jgi:hypothetical protein